MLFPSTASAVCASSTAIEWISVLDRDNPGAHEHIWLLHGAKPRVNVLMNGEPLTLAEQTDLYSRYIPSTTEPGTHTLELQHLDADGAILEETSETYTTSTPEKEDTRVVLRKWRDLESTSDALCARIASMQDCFDIGPPNFRQAVTASGEPFGYKVQLETKDGGWETQDGFWPGVCPPIIPDYYLGSEGAKTDARLLVVDSRGQEHRSPDRTALLGDGNGCSTSRSGQQPPSLWLFLFALVFVRRRLSAHAHSRSR
jgi:hypothetical protein